MEASTISETGLGNVTFSRLTDIAIDMIDGENNILTIGGLGVEVERLLNVHATLGDQDAQGRDDVEFTLAANVTGNMQVSTVSVDTVAFQIADSPLVMVTDGAGVLDAIELNGNGGGLDRVGSTGDDVFTVQQDGSFVRIAQSIDGTPRLPIAVSGFNGISIFGGKGADQLNVDNSGGVLSLSDRLVFDGEFGMDTVRLIGSTIVDGVTYNFASDINEDQIVQSLDGGDLTIHINGLENVVDLLAHRVAGTGMTINGTPDADSVVYTPSPLSGTAAVNSLNAGRLVVDTSKTLDFANKTSLTINGLGGDDRIRFDDQNLPTGLTGVSLHGGTGNDIVVGSAGNDSLHGDAGDDLLRGLGGDDQLDAGTGVTNVIDGGEGTDTVVISDATSDAVDTVELRQGRTRVNGGATFLEAIEALTLESHGGNDVIDVVADTTVPADFSLVDVLAESGTIRLDPSNAAYPATVTADLGDGDDQLNFNITDQLPATSVSVIGGDGDDRVTGQGRIDLLSSGSVAGSVFGPSSLDVVSGVETHEVREVFVLDNGRSTPEKSSQRFIDRDGNQVTVRLQGAGTATVVRDRIAESPTDIQSIELQGTDARRSALRIDVRRAAGTDNVTTVGSISGTGLRDILGRSVNLEEGIDVIGGVQRTTLNNVADGASIDMTGAAGIIQQFRLANVRNVNLSTDASIRLLQANFWTGGSVQAHQIGQIRTKGDWGADIMTTRTNIAGPGLFSLSVREGILSSSIQTDSVGTIQVIGGDATLNLNVTGSVAELGRLYAVNRIDVRGGNLTNSSITMQSGTVLRSLRVAATRGVGGEITGPFTIQGNVMQIDFADVRDSLHIEGSLLRLMRTRGACDADQIRTNGSDGVIQVDLVETRARIICVGRR